MWESERINMNKLQQRVLLVLNRMADLVEKDVEYAEIFSIELQEFLEILLKNDVFGTEGQSDPRGDMRIDNFSMDYVQYIDL